MNSVTTGSPTVKFIQTTNTSHKLSLTVSRFGQYVSGHEALGGFEGTEEKTRVLHCQ